MGTSISGWNRTAIARDPMMPAFLPIYLPVVIVAGKILREAMPAHDEVTPQADDAGSHLPTDLR
jgi:hypothetical protein